MSSVNAMSKEHTVKTLVSNKGYSIFKADLDEHGMLRSLKEELTVKPITHPNYPDSAPFPAYDEGIKWLRVPRFFGIQRFGQPTLSVFPSTLDSCERLRFTGALWEKQRKPHDDVLAWLRTENSGLLCLHTAGGKTVITLSLIAHLKVRTCILVHKSQLLQQWKERIAQFLPSAKVAIVQGKMKDFSPDVDIHIVMIQTLLNVPVVPSLFGFTVVDECHRLPSETFSRVLFKVNAPYMLGLSATPQRKDGLTSLLHWHLGDIIFQEKPDRSGQKTTQVDVYRFNSGSLNLDIRQYSQSITRLAGCPERNRYIVDIVGRILEQDLEGKRRLLVLTDRVNHATILRKSIQELSMSPSCGLLSAGMSQEAFSTETSKQIVIGTYGLMLEGIDIPDLNGIFMVTPRRTVAQAIGRILRKVHSEIHPLIAEISDSDFRGQERVRLATYRVELDGNIRVTFHDQ
jgi:superfamily II DNA or RNA helicase